MKAPSVKSNGKVAVKRILDAFEEFVLLISLVVRFFDFLRSIG